VSINGNCGICGDEVVTKGHAQVSEYCERHGVHKSTCMDCPNEEIKRLTAELVRFRAVLTNSLRFAGHIGNCDWAASTCSCGYLTWRTDRYLVLTGNDGSR
jgi:hypothetical protein